VSNADPPCAELKEPEKYNTLDPLHDPATAVEQLQL